MMEKKVNTYQEAIDVIEEVGLLPLATLIPDYPSLNTITMSENWYLDTEYDPWIWRTKFSSDGVAGYGKFIKKKSVLISRQLLPYMKNILGHSKSVEERYFNGIISKEALELFKLIGQEGGIDTRNLRVKAGLKESHKKRIFENALLELQGAMDIVISGIQVKKNGDGEKNGWNSTAFETYDSWAERNNIETFELSREEAKRILMIHFSSFCSNEVVKKFEKIFK
ncbi:hypothetical protein FA727_05560 [Robertmurraya kyonggiensis]|uniref:Uncharacterized protein n=2 Tax=Robertmurraya kyonggiensis TaxID=1037680 RepID=A0A4U1D9B0_9BACI|nr:hypothetical protein FA727_05560 [Robertmurraya kyonggiensis]